jgi:ABC-type lipoprotein release transport system permease subunit
MDEHRTEQRTTAKGLFSWFGCLMSIVGCIFGTLVGIGLVLLLWPRIYPPSGPSYGDGMGWGLAMLFWAGVSGIIGAVIGTILGTVVGVTLVTNRQ